MSFNWRDYVDLAQDLLNRAEEACQRSSISRAYYGVFCLARNRKGYKNIRALMFIEKLLMHTRIQSIEMNHIIIRILP